jgi:hypothetical protein
MAMAATIITVGAATRGGSANRRTASHTIAPVAIKRMAALASAARIDAERKPYVYRSVGSHRASMYPAHASRSPSASPKLCPASAIRAMDCAWMP